MNSHGGSIDVGSVIAFQPVGSQKASQQGAEVEEPKDHHADLSQPVVLELVPHQLPLGCREIVLSHFLGYVVASSPWQEQALCCGQHQPFLLSSRMRGSSQASSMSEMRVPTTVSTAIRSNQDPARYMSWPSRASNMTGPCMGRLSTMAV